MSAGVSTRKMVELNNNNSPELFSYQQHKNIMSRSRNQSVVSVSSVSSCCSDSSNEDNEVPQKELSSTSPLLLHQMEAEGGEEGGVVADAQKDNDTSTEKAECRKFRSMSDGAVYRLSSYSHRNHQDSFEVFPSLPDTVLEKMGLLGNGPRERLNEEELEQKYAALALAFTIDAVTIKDRCQRQRRYRDQTETNFSVEIERLIQKANRIQPLCVDAETTELLTGLLAQIDIVMRAAALATISSERYGAVQHEDRISESVNIMINHVNLLKQQRDSARRQLQYTKRVLQNTNSTEIAPGANKPAASSAAVPNGRLITKRRASIATITQQSLVRPADVRKITRRTSDLSLRATLSRISHRPSRLELGVDLVKINEIKEGAMEHEPPANDDAEPTPNQSDDESIHNEDSSSLEDTQEDSQKSSLRQRLVRRLHRLRTVTERRYDKWTEDGTVHDFCCLCSLLCFSIGIILLANVFIEVEFAKRGLAPSNFFWYSTGQDAPHSTKKLYYGSVNPT